MNFLDYLLNFFLHIDDDYLYQIFFLRLQHLFQKMIFHSLLLFSCYYLFYLQKRENYFHDHHSGHLNRLRLLFQNLKNRNLIQYKLEKEILEFYAFENEFYKKDLCRIHFLLKNKCTTLALRATSRGSRWKFSDKEFWHRKKKKKSKFII